MSHLNVFDDKVPFIVRDNLWNYCINSTYRLGWEDTDVPEKYDLNIHSHWSVDELESTEILPHFKKCIDETDWFTNNKLSNNEFPLHISYDLVSNHRFFRMQNLFAKREYHTFESFKEIQIDNISTSARILIPLLAKDLWYSQVLEIDNKFLNLRKEAIDLLAEWNGEMSIYLPQPLIFYTWAAQFQKMVMQDEIGKNVNWFNSVNSNFIERVLRNINGASAWCDIKQTSKLETCEEISSKALDNALVTIANKYGQDIKKWLWGNYHKAYFSDKVLGKYPIISYLTNIVFEVSGGDDTLSMNLSLIHI